MAAGLAFAADTCEDDFEITSTNPQFDCEVVEGTVTVKEDVNGELVIKGPKQFKGDFIVSNVTNLLSITSDSLNSIGGEFLLEDLNLLNNMKLTSLESVNKLTIRRLKLLKDLAFGSSGVSKATDVEITDCMSMSDLSNLQLTTVQNFKIINNPALVKFDSSLESINETFIITGNGKNMNVTLSQLQTAKNLQISDVSGFAVPALEMVSEGMRFENNTNMESFEAKNLTQVGESEKEVGSLSFNNNKVLQNLSFPVLEKINGDLTILNNTNLTEISGFPELTSVYGALLIGGSNIEEIDMPKIETFGGAVTVQSSTGSDKVCSFLENASVAGKKACDVEKAEDEANSGDGKGGGKSGSGGDDEGSAATYKLSSAAIGLAVVAGFAQLL